MYEKNDAFSFNQCIAEGQVDVKQILDDVKNSASKALANAMDTTAEYSIEKWDAINKSVAETIDSANDATSMFWKSAKDWLEY